MENNLLSRILTGEATSEEKSEFYRRLSESKEEEELFYEVKSLWLRTSMQKKIIDADAEFKMLWKQIQTRERKISFPLVRKITRYAAVMVLILGIGGVSGYFISMNSFEYTDPGTQKYTAMPGSVSLIEFPDGTKVWLNADSELTYREDRDGKQRLAELTGEAYFEVTHRDDFPFLVKANELVIRDLGTTFNIKAYPQDNYIETSLVEGEVDLLNAKGNSFHALKPGESALYFPEEKKIELRSISGNVLSAWREGKFVIRDQKLEDIFKELSRWYGVKFQFEHQELRNYRFTGNIKKSTTPLHVLEMLQLTTHFNYRVIEKNNEPDVIIVY